MRLYKMELYKLCHRKVFIIGAVCILGILLSAFWIHVMDEESTVDGTRRQGLPAVRMNREITEEYKGALTDEKAEQIIARYGFPDKREEGWNYFRNANFLNQFVMDYLSDGYMYSYDDYRVGSRVYSIADTGLGAVQEYTGKEIILEYYRGWSVFLDIFTLGMILSEILLLFTISAVFADEGQKKMLPLLFTAKEGKKKDTIAKIGAAFTVAAGVWACVFILTLFLCGTVYGFDGLNCYNGMAVSYLMPMPDRIIPMYVYVMMVLVLSLFGILSLCAATLCLSAYCKGSFHAVTAAAVCWGAPFLLMLFTNGFNGIFKVLSAAPIFMVLYEIVDKIYDVWLMPIGISVAVIAGCICKGYGRYERQQG
ncbi:MAG: hypothetical protein NC419_01300 [Muribaculaceae bacterium]|nr:hypothetical protein [Muribaculaceae bacterium]